MNDTRRRALAQIQDQLAELREALFDLCAAEQEAFDNIPESLQGGERYEKAEAACDALCDAVDNLDEVNNGIDEACEV